MKTSSVLKAMEMAVKKRKYRDDKLIHHSDRGFQYCYDLYANYLEEHNIGISTTLFSKENNR